MNSLELKQESAFTLLELLVGMMIFGIVSMGIATFAGGALRNLGTQNRVSHSGAELRQALALLSTELRMSGSVSPYLVGTSAGAVTCTGSLAVTSTSIKFVVVNDDSSSSTNGLKAYYVGYKYDPSSKQLLRGEIAKAGVSDCSLPAGDPTSSTYAKPIAENVVQFDADGNGSLDAAFALSSDVLSVKLGIEIEGAGGEKATDYTSTKIYVRLN